MSRFHRKSMLLTAVLLAVSTPLVADPANGDEADDLRPVIRSLMSDRNLSSDQAVSFLRNQANASMAAPGISGRSGVSTDDMAIDKRTGKLVGYYQSNSQRTALQRNGVIAKPTSLSSRDLAERMDRIVSRIPVGVPGFHSADIDVANQAVSFYGTSAFFASSFWKGASAGEEVTPVVEESSVAPSPSVAQPVPGNYQKTPASPAGTYGICSVGWVTQQNWVVTAGHCTYDPHSKYPINSLGRTVYNSASSPFGTTRSSLYQNGGNDWGKIVLYSGAGASGTGYYANYAGGKKSYPCRAAGDHRRVCL